MGDQDRPGKLFMACRDVFAELVNVLVYQGEKVLAEERMYPGPTESVYPRKTAELASQFQDYSMYEVVQGEVHASYTVENQSRVDRWMVLRHAGYEGVAYRRQYRKGKEEGYSLTGQPSEGQIQKGEISIEQSPEECDPAEEEGIYPVISLVLNWGEKRWTAATTIPDLLDYPVHRGAEDYLYRNRMHVFDMRFLDREERSLFEGDMRVILDYLSDRESLIRRRQKLRNPEEVMRMLHALSGDTRYLENITIMKEEGGSVVCDLLDEMVNKGIEIGKQEGIEEGIEIGKQEGIEEGIEIGKQEGIEEGIQKGKQEGLKEGIQEGIKALISTCREFDVSFDKTVAKVKEKFCMEDGEIGKSMKLYWK